MYIPGRRDGRGHLTGLLISRGRKSKGSKQVDGLAGRHRMAWRGVIRRVHLFVFYIWRLSPHSGTLISLVLHTSSGSVTTEGHLLPEYYRLWHFLVATLSHRVGEAA